MDRHLDVTVKATPLKAVLAFMDRELDAPARDRVIESVRNDYPDEVRRIRERAIIMSERVPVSFVNRLIEATAAEIRQPAPLVAHRIGRAGAEDAAGGMLRLALAVISIPNLLLKLGPIWKQINSHGTMTNKSDKNSALLELTDYPLVSATGCARVTGFFEWFAQRAEKTATINHYECRARGGALCRWKIQW